MEYSKKIDKKWQDKWKEKNVYKFEKDSKKEKLYTLEMFSYPSGAKLHLGHWFNYAPADTYARFKKMQGYNVFHPMGFDAFGLPAENYAIKTGIHPESYPIAANLLNLLDLDIKDINTDAFKTKLREIDIKDYVQKLNTDEYTLSDIVKELLTPGLDPRDELEAPILKSDILHIEDLKVGMELEGTVRNVASFGAFVDIGLHDDGLVHISKMSKQFVKNPNDILNVGDIIKCYVDKVDLEKGKVNLSLFKD